MNTFQIIMFIAGILGIFAHAFKAADDRNRIQEADYTFGMYFKKNRYSMYFVAICILVFSYYQEEWTRFQKLGEWRGLITFGMGFMGDSIFPSLFSLLTIISDKIKAAVSGGNKA